jgi:transposase-like protein
MTCVDPHVKTCPKCVRNMEEPVYLVRVDGGCDAAYLCTDCKNTWEIAWGCGK